MSVYTSGIKTGRSRTVKLEGSFYGPATAGTLPVYTLGSFWINYWYYWSRTNGAAQWNGFSISFAAAVTGTGSNAGWPIHNRVAYSVSIDSRSYTGGELRTLTGTSGDILVGNSGTGALPAPSTIAGAVSGTYSIEFDVEEWMVVTPFTPISDPWPPSGTDGVLGIYLKFEERVKIGLGVIRISVTSNAGNYTKSFDNAAAGYTLPSYQPLLRSGSAAEGAYPGGDAAYVTGQCAGLTMGYSRSYTYADPGPPVVVNGAHAYNGIMAAGSYPRGGYTNDSSLGAKTTQNAGWYPPTNGASPVGMSISQIPTSTVAVEGLTLDFGGGLMSVPSLQAQWYAGRNAPMSTLFEVPPLSFSSGSLFGSKELINTQLTGFGSFTGEVTFSDFKTFAELYNLGVSGEEAGDIALVGGYTTFDAFSIAHAASTSVDDCSSGVGWAAGANTTVTATGTTIQLAAAGGTGSATKTYGTAKNAEGYRYLDVKFRSAVNAGVTVRVTIGQKYWDIATAGAGAYVTRSIDLMRPDGTLAALTAQQDSRWPIDNNVSNTPSNEGLNWGVNRISTLIVGSIPNGETIELDDLTLARKRTATAHFSNAYKPIAGVYELAVGPPASPIARRFLLCHTDGRQSVEAHDTWATIDDLATEANKIPGITASGLGGPDSYFNSANLPPYMLAAWGGVLTDLTSYLERDITGAGATIKAQFLFDALGFYPGCGDVLGSGSYGDTVYHRLAPKVLRGHGHGILLDTAGDPVAGQLVLLRENPSGIGAGQGSSDAGGYYRTGFPHGRGGKYFDFIGNPPVTNIRIAPRKKQRENVHYFPVSAADVDDLQTPEGEHHISYISSGDIIHRWSRHSEAAWDFLTQVTSSKTWAGGWARPRVAIDTALHLHLVAYHTNQGGGDPLASGLYYFQSDDNGQSFTDPSLVMANATMAMIRCAKDGGPMMMVVFIPDAGTTGPGIFKSKWKPNPETAWTALVTMKDQAGSDLRSAGYQFGFDHAADAADPWTLAYLPEGGTDPVSRQCTDKGSTWRLLS